MRRQLNVRRVDAPRRLTRRTKTAPTPIVKWAGGKTKLLSHLTGHFPENYKRYFEPFLGGAALFFHAAPEKSVLNDMNVDLVNMYQMVAGDVSAVIRRLRWYRNRHNDEFYYKTRERWNERPNPMSEIDRAAAFIYLNKTCYNGLWRVNSKGLFNVPLGSYKNPQLFDEATLRAASEVIGRAELRTGSFVNAVKGAKKGDLVYFDPPYHPLNDTAKFTSYTANSFGAKEQRQLAELVQKLAKRGCHVILSNSDTPFIRKLYADFTINKVLCPRAINSRAKGRGPIPEVIVTTT